MKESGYQTPLAIFAWGDENTAKMAALFFTRIFPMFKRDKVPDEVRLGGTLISHALIDRCEAAVMRMFQDRYKQFRILDENFDSISKKELLDLHINIFLLKFHENFCDEGLPSVPFFQNCDLFTHFLPEGYSDALEVKVANIGVINTAELDWGQILDMRRDQDSIAKLGRLRLFMTVNYKDKDINYIRDDLLVRIYEYERACKKHGLELVHSSISKILDSKSLLGMLGISAASLLLGESTIASASMLTGTAIEIGKVAIHISEKKLEFKSRQRNSEIAYLMDLTGKT